MRDYVLCISYFLTWGNIESIVMQFSTEGIVVIGMTVMLILASGIDISVGSIMLFHGTSCKDIFSWCQSLDFCLSRTRCMPNWCHKWFLRHKGGFASLCYNPCDSRYYTRSLLCSDQGSQISLYTLPDSFKYIGLGKVSGIPFYHRFVHNHCYHQRFYAGRHQFYEMCFIPAVTIKPHDFQV